MKRLAALPLDYLTTSFLLSLIPFLFRWRGIPLNYEWTSFFIPYWISVSLYSIFFAALFYTIQKGLWPSLRLAFRPFAEKPFRLLFLIGLVSEMVWVLGVWKAIIIFSDFLAGFSYLLNLRKQNRPWIKDTMVVFIPAFYFCIGFILIASYNVLIGTLRYYGSYDNFFNALDKSLMLGWSVTELSQVLSSKASPSLFLILEKIYFFMFPQIGAAIILLTAQNGVKQAMRFVGAVAIAYQLATLLYFCFPSLGPFLLSKPLSAGLPSDLVTSHIQAELVQKLETLWHTGTKNSIGLDFYIAFPCMHLAQPLIVLWFLRSMGRVTRVLMVYDFFMIFSILFLQWHYFVDLIGGLLVAVVALAIHQMYLSRIPAGTVEESLNLEPASSGMLQK